MASIRKRNGKWQAQIRREGYKSISRSFHKRSDAVEWARHKEVQADRRELLPSNHAMTQYSVRDVLERYRKEVTPGKKSHAQETITITFLLKQKFSDLTFDTLNENHMAEFRDMRLKTVKPATVVRELAILQHALEVAIREWGLPIRSNPVKQIKKPRVNNARNRRLSDSEFSLLLKATNSCRNPWIKPMILFAIYSGMRQSEILNMQWDDVDLTKRILHIPISKNGRSRTIPLSNKAAGILKDLPAGKNGKVFDLSASSFRQAWKRIIKRSKIENLRFHDLRHEAISRFFEHGLSIPEVALISGHRDFRMLARYTHLQAEDIARKL